MSTSLLDALLAEFTGSSSAVHATTTAAKAANPANQHQSCTSEPVLRICDDPRSAANSENSDDLDVPDSQAFASIRKPESTRLCQHGPAFSQLSQHSQQDPVHCEPVNAYRAPSTGRAGIDSRRFLDRRDRLMRWGWSESDAEGLAKHLSRRDRDGCGDDRVCCADCEHYRPGRCGNHRRAGLNVADIGRDLASLLQRCPGFEPIGGRHDKQEP